MPTFRESPSCGGSSGQPYRSFACPFQFEYADESQLRTQLAWAAADERLSFVGLVGAVQALRHLLAEPPEQEAVVRVHVGACLKRAVEVAPPNLHPDVREFIRLITDERARVRSLTDEGLAGAIGVTFARLSQAVYEQIGISPRECRLIADTQPALQQLAHSDEQVAQIGYRIGYGHASAFDRGFPSLMTTPRFYRGLLTGSVFCGLLVNQAGV